MDEANYEGFSVIGRSPYATTYRAYAILRRQVVVLKVYRHVRRWPDQSDAVGTDGVTDNASGGGSTDPTGAFFATVRQWAAAPSERLVAPLEAGTSARGEAYLARPRMAGESLAVRSAARGALDLPTVMRIGSEASSAVAALNALGLAHGAMSPSNIFLDEHDGAWVTDPLPPIARDLLAAGPLLRPGHIAPEVLAGGPFTDRSDSYSIMSSIAVALGHRPLPGALSEMVDAGLANDPQQRPTPAELTEFFAEAAQDTRSTQRPATRWRHVRSEESAPAAIDDLVGDAERADDRERFLDAADPRPADGIDPIAVAVADRRPEDAIAEAPEEVASAPAETVETVATPLHTKDRSEGRPTDQAPTEEQRTVQPPLGATRDRARRAADAAQEPMVISIGELQADIIERNAHEQRRRRRRSRLRTAGNAAAVVTVVGAIAAGAYVLDRQFGDTTANTAGTGLTPIGPDGRNAEPRSRPAADPVAITINRWFEVAGPRGQRQIVMELTAKGPNGANLPVGDRSGARVAVLLGRSGDYSPPPDSGLGLVDLGRSPAELGLEPPAEAVARVRCVFANPEGVTETFTNPTHGAQITTVASTASRAVLYVPDAAEILGVALLDNENRALGVVATNDWGAASAPVPVS